MRDNFYHDQLHNHTTIRVYDYHMEAELYFSSSLREVIEYIRNRVSEQVFIVIDNKSSEHIKIASDIRDQLFHALGNQSHLIADVS